ncbi:hypothetical protein KJ813_01335 [bacterium]|nr:hypothetical protein [bacterium]
MTETKIFWLFLLPLRVKPSSGRWRLLLLLSYQRPVELRKGIVREGTFKYITHNNYYCGEETFFAPDEVRENSYEDYLEKTVSYFIKKDAEKLSPTRAG